MGAYYSWKFVDA